MTYDTLIVGGGPSGLTAGLHLAWHDRSVIIVDRKTGPLNYTLEQIYNIGAGPANWAAGLAIRLKRYTPRVSVLLTSETESDLHPDKARLLRSADVPVISGRIRKLHGRKRFLEALELEDETVLKGEAFFVSNLVKGRTDLAKQLGITIAPTGEHARPASQRGDTNILGVWVAGDLRPMTQQIDIAAGTGKIAAVMIDQFLHRKDIG